MRGRPLHRLCGASQTLRKACDRQIPLERLQDTQLEIIHSQTSLLNRQERGRCLNSVPMYDSVQRIEQGTWPRFVCKGEHEFSEHGLTCNEREPANSEHEPVNMTLEQR